MSLPREILKWILSLDLSYQVKSPRRDFANGFLFAEILSRYFPADIQMHSFENVASIERKRSNWTLLERFFKRKGMSVERAQVNAIISAEGDVCIEVLQTIYNWIQGPEYEDAREPCLTHDPERMEALAQPREIRDRGYEASTSDDDDGEDFQDGNAGGYYGQMAAAFAGHGQAAGGYSGGYEADESSMAGYHVAEKPIRPTQKKATSVNKGSGAVGRVNGRGKPPKPESPPEPLSPVQQPYNSFNQEQYFASMAQQQYMPPHQDYSSMGMQPQMYPNGMMMGGMGMYGMQPAYGYGSQPAPAYPMFQPPQIDVRASPSVMAGQRHVGQIPSAGPPPAPSSNERFKSPMRGRGNGSSNAGHIAPAASPPSAAYSPLLPSSSGSGCASQMPKLVSSPGSGYASQIPKLGAGLRPKPGSSSAMSAYAYEAMLAQQAAAAAHQQQQQFAQQYAEVLEAPTSAVAEEKEGLPYSRKPRVVDYQPYELKDFEDKEYNIKREGKEYWQLGRLGPDMESEELQAKREKAERVKQMAAQVREDNFKKAAVAKPQAKPAKEPTARDRALEFAKKVPKPEVMLAPPPLKPEPKKKPGAANAAVAAKGAAAIKPLLGGNDLESLEALHDEDQSRVDKIRAELARLRH